jgi:hypothetical protein
LTTPSAPAIQLAGGIAIGKASQHPARGLRPRMQQRMTRAAGMFLEHHHRRRRTQQRLRGLHGIKQRFHARRPRRVQQHLAGRRLEEQERIGQRQRHLGQGGLARGGVHAAPRRRQ